MCPGDTLVFTCVVKDTNGAVVWRRNNSQNPRILNYGQPIPSFDFTLSITSYNTTTDKLVSTATRDPVPVDLGGTISCSHDLITFTLLPINVAGMHDIIIIIMYYLIIGPPVAVVSNITFTATNNNSLLINWITTESCINTYNVTINSSNIITNTTNIRVSDLIIGSNYSFTIIPIDTVGREGPPSSLVQYIWNGMNYNYI